MTYDFAMNTLLVVTYVVLAALVIYKLTWKPLSIKVDHFPTFIRMTYKHGWKTRVAQVAVSSDIFKPTVAKNFNYFTFVLPIDMTLGDAMRWLNKVEVDKMYADHGRDAIELLRSMALYYYTRDLERFQTFVPRCNHMRILQAMRKNRYMIKQLLEGVAKPSSANLPYKAATVRSA